MSMDHGVSDYLRHMPAIGKYGSQLNSLDDAWEHIKRLAEVTCPEEAKTILPSMERTQGEFKALQGRLLESLVEENLRKATLEIASKAQVAVDILIRNLFERTADVGFLATDLDLIGFLVDSPEDPDALASLRRRLEEYVRKYTVYEEIVVLDGDGVVRANLDPSNPILGKSLERGLVDATLKSTAPYLETFRTSELQPSRRQSLTYSCKIIDPSAPERGPVGVLCLCFKFEDEMRGIFKSLRREGDKSLMMILDSAGVVIASNDARQVPPGAEMEPVLGEEFRVIDYAGREHLAATRPTKGYQGFKGLGWMGHVMTPCDAAFRGDPAKALEGLDQALAARAVSASQSSSSSLSDIASRAAMINLGLRRVVWNGQVMNSVRADGSSRLKPVLAQISKTGARTIDLFSESIRDLHSTVISSSLADAKFLARLAIDIMDRNLYERSDDCRWWALTSSFRRLLSADPLPPEASSSISATLACLNGLYTVYSSLFIYDRRGVVVAVSKQEDSALVGRSLDEPFVQQTLQLCDSQRYSVSPFARSPLYAGRHTYIYGASITDPSDSKRVVGGIGIVFDSEPQFEAMLRDAIPSGDACFAVFADRDGSVISSTRSSLKTGSRLEIDPSLFKLPNGEGASRILEFDGRLWIVGCTCSSGYREYKNSGDYKNDVLAFVFTDLGDASISSDSSRKRLSVLEGSGSNGLRRGAKTVEIASFVVGGRHFAFDKELVEESVGCDRLTSRLPGSAEYLEGTMSFRDSIVPVVNLRVICGLPRKEHDLYTQVVVVRLPSGDFLGLLVDDLDGVPEVDAERVHAVPAIISGDAGYVSKLVKGGDDVTEMILVLEPSLILKAAKEGVHPNGHSLPGANGKRNGNGHGNGHNHAVVAAHAAP